MTDEFTQTESTPKTLTTEKAKKQNKNQKKSEKLVNCSLVFNDDSFIPTIVQRPVKTKNSWKNKRRNPPSPPRRFVSNAKVNKYNDYCDKKDFEKKDKQKGDVKRVKKQVVKSSKSGKQQMRFEAHASIRGMLVNALDDGRFGTFNPAHSIFSAYGAMYGLGSVLAQDYLAMVERCFHMFRMMRAILGCPNDENRKDAIIALVLNEVTHYSGKSTAQNIMSYLTRLEFPFEHHAGGFEEFDKFFSSVKSGWRDLAESPLSKLLYKVMSLSLTSGLCHVADLKFTIGNLEIFNRDFVPKMTSVNDFVDGVLCVVESFAKVGYKCFTEGSLMPLLSSDDMDSFEHRHHAAQLMVSSYSLGNLEIEYDLNDEGLETLLHNLIKDLTIKIASTKNMAERRLYDTTLHRVDELFITFKKYRKTGLPRVKPYTIAIVGPPGGGKSVFSDQVAQIGMAALEEEYDRSIHYLRMNLEDQYNSMASNRTKVVVVDDLSNVKDPDTNPINSFIQLANNVSYPVAQADLESKRGIELKPKILIVTSNLQDLGANLYSHEPASVMRRPDCFVELTPHEQFCYPGTRQLDGNKVHRDYVGPETFYKDLFRVTAYRYDVDVKLGHGKTNYKRVNLLNDVSYGDFLRWYVGDITRQQNIQNKLLSEVNTVGDEPLCKVNKLPEHLCPPGTFTPHSSDLLDAVSRCLDVMHNFDIHFMGQVIQRLPLSWISFFEESPIPLPPLMVNQLKEFTLIPSFLRNKLRRTILVSKASVGLCLFCLKYSNHFLWMSVLCLLLGTYSHIIWLYIPTLCFIAFVLYSRWVLEAADKIAKESRVTVNTWREWFTKDFVPYCIVGIIVYKLVPLVKMLEGVRTMYSITNFSAHGSLDPSSDEDVQKRDKSENVWVKPVVRELPLSHRVKCTSVDQLMIECGKNTSIARTTFDGGKADVNCFFVGSNVALLPLHFVKLVGNNPVEFYKHDFGPIRGYFKDFINHRYVNIPGTDLCLVWLANSGNKKSLMEYFPDDYISGRIPAKAVFRDSLTCNIIEDSLICEDKLVSHTYMSFPGYVGKYSFVTKKGMCMGSLVTNSKGPQIFGFHLGGSGELGCMGRIRKRDIEDAFKRLQELPGVLPTGDEGIFRNTRSKGSVVFSKDVSRKSSVNFVTEQSFDVFGAMSTRSHPRSRVVPTLISDSVTRHTATVNEWGPPKFKGPEVFPFTSNLQKCVEGSKGMPPEHLQWAVLDFIKPILGKLDSLPALKDDIRPWTNVEALSGIPGKKFCDAMALKTSAGFGLPGKKSEYVKDIFDDRGVYSHREPTPTLLEELEHVENAWSRGERSDAVFTASLKDEPTPLKSEKVRVFQAGPMGHYLGVKKRVGSVIRALRMMNIVSETAVGTDPTSPEWEDLMGYAMKFGLDRVIAGDYSGYDKRLPPDVLGAAWWIIHQIAKECGYEDGELLKIRCMSSDTIYSYQAYDGTLIRMVGSEPSGEPLTVDIDSICGCLMMRCAYYQRMTELGRELVPFRDLVALIHNGDDHIGSVSKDLPGFDQVFIAEWLTSRGMKYTGTDKTSEVSVPFSYGPETEFLKRTTVSVEGLPFKVGALLQSSIFKSLHSKLQSTEITDEVHSAQVIEGALREALFHGRTYYEGLRASLIKVAQEHKLLNICPGLNLQYDNAIGAHAAKFGFPDKSKLVAPTDSTLGCKAKSGGHCMVYHDGFRRSLTDEVGGFSVQANVVFTTGLPPPKRTHWMFRLSCLASLIMLNKLATTEMKNEMNEKPSEVMKETATEIVPLGSTQEENVYYHEEQTSFIMKRDDEKSVAHLEGTMSDITLGSFVTRPVRIQTFSWAVGGGVEVNFNPWNNYFSNPAVLDKINNFYRIQCGLRVKFQIVGNQFNYGRLLVAYQPFVTGPGNQDLNQIYPWPGVTAPFTPDNADLCLLSQYPHLYLDPVNNAGGEIEIPFLWYRNYYEVPTADWRQAGSIIITTLSNLEAANGSTDPVTIQVIAQPINFTMDVPTEFEPQSNIVFDAQMNFVSSLSQFDPGHPISSGMGIAAEGAGMMAKAKGKKKNKKARKFAKGAKTAQLALKMAGNTASKFGFTRQPNAYGCNAYVPRLLNSFALTEGTSECIPLTCFMDTQLTVSPERFGVGNTDELTVQAVACKEAYFNKFTWSVSDTAGTNLFGCEVSPAIWTTNQTSGMVGMTPSCFAVQPFEYWSGTINFRFQIVSSSFHKGVILIKYDPDAQATGTDLNLQTLASIDISKDRDITVEVGMSQIYPWLYHRSVIAPVGPANVGGGYLPAYSTVGPFLNNSGVVTIPQITGDLLFNYKERSCFNGVISVQVFNTLVVPANSTSQNVEVLCHMSAGSDFKVGAPTDTYIRDMTFFPNVTPPVAAAAGGAAVAGAPRASANTPVNRDRRSAPFEAQSDVAFEAQMDSSNDPVAPSDGAPEALTIAHHFGAGIPDGSEICDQYMGECVESLRVLLHRKCFHSVILYPNVGGLNYFAATISDFPNYCGDVKFTISNTNTARRPVNMTFLNYITAAYALRSGSISNTYSKNNIANNAIDPGTLVISRCEKGVVASVFDTLISETDEAEWVYNGTAANGRAAGGSGQHATSRILNPNLDVNMPYYDGLNGYPAQMSAVDEGNLFCRMHRIEGYDRTLGGVLQRFVCAGPDYSLGMFLSAPPVYQRDFTSV